MRKVWILASSAAVYNHEKSFNENNGLIEWSITQHGNKIKVNDIIALYSVEKKQFCTYLKLQEQILIILREKLW